MSSARTDSSSTSKDRDIRQIIPTSGHLAVYFDEETGDPWADIIIGWALVADSAPESGTPARSKIIGLVSEGREIIPVDEFPNFLGYMSPDGSLEDWKEDAQAAWEEKKSGAWPDAGKIR
jgi:hypothetical protein